MSSVAPKDVSVAVARFCGNSEGGSDSATLVTTVETHISWLFLAGRYAFKLKKPVRFEFLDFSTPELRRQACRDELRLNRRLAPDVYLAVLPITRADTGELRLGGYGTRIDWVVQMQRLDDSHSLRMLIQNDKLITANGDAIINHLAGFYRSLPKLDVMPEDYQRTLERHIRANATELLTAPKQERPRVRRTISAQLRYLHVQSNVLAKRVAEGRIVDGHGDLRPEHIYFDGRPVVIDCVEFSEELRHVDVADDLSFLAMECEHLGAMELGNRIMATCEQICGDVVPAQLSAFYRCYRACVRAKVALLRARQQPNAVRNDTQFNQYLHLADIHAAELGPPMLLVVGGLTGSGKSTLAAELSRQLGIACFSTDQCRRDLFGTSYSPAAYGEALYRPNMRQRIYDEVLKRAAMRLRQGESAILDGTFLTVSLQENACKLARHHGAAPLFILCTCPRSVAITRIEERRARQHDASEARPEFFDLQSQEFETPTQTEAYTEVDTVCPLRDQLRKVFFTLRPVLFG